MLANGPELQPVTLQGHSAFPAGHSQGREHPEGELLWLLLDISRRVGPPEPEALCLGTVMSDAFIRACEVALVPQTI